MMYKDIIISKLRDLRVSYEVRGDEVNCTCLNPEHNDKNPSFSINTHTGLFYCFSCGFSGHIRRVWEDLKIDPETERSAAYSSLLDQWDTDDTAEVEDLSYLLPPIDHYVTYDIRGISSELLEQLGVYYCSTGRYKGRIVFPIKDIYGTVLGFDARIHQPSGKPKIEANYLNAKYLRSSKMSTKDILYPLDFIHNSGMAIGKPIILTEGVFDALSYIELGYAAVCNFGLSGPSPTKVGRLLSLSPSEIINGFDPVQSGFDGWQKIKDSWRQYLPIGKPLSIIKELKDSGFDDINQYLQEGM